MKKLIKIGTIIIAASIVRVASCTKNNSLGGEILKPFDAQLKV